MKSLICLFVIFTITYANAVIWPLSRSTGENGDIMTSAFGPRNNGGIYQIHYGLDLRAAEGTVFYSIADGYVEEVDSTQSTGNYITIRHLDNSYVRYIHLQSRPPYTQGEFVQEDQVIGLTGRTGTTFAHLHIDYFPTNYSPTSPFYRLDTYNPLDILPHNTTDDFLITNLTYVTGGGTGGEDQLRFDVQVHPQRLDVNRIEMDIFSTYDVQCNLQSEREILDTEEGFIAAQWGLIELVNTYREAGMDSALSHLQNTLQTHPDEGVRQVAGDLLTGEYLRQKQVDAAIARAQQNLTDHPNTGSEKLALFDLFNIYFVDRGDAPAAQAYLAQLESRYPGDELTRQAQLLSGGGGAGAGMAMAKGGEVPVRVHTQAALPEKFELQQNYPNPFNPTTTIELALPQDSEVQLVIYDISGRKVRTLVQAALPAGFHEIVWNGRNDAGQPVSSGVYLYRAAAVAHSPVQGNRFTQVRKMMLMR